MYKIEYNEETTLEGLLESFKILKETGIRAYVEIDSIKIYDSDPNLKEKLTKIFQSKKKDKEIKPVKQESIYRKISEKDKVAYEAIDKMTKTWKLSCDEVFKYYLGVSLKYIKPEYREGLKKNYIEVYSNDRFDKIRDIHLLASILLILEYKDVFVIQEKLNMFFLNISKEDAEMLNIVVKKIEDYAINGSLIKQCFSRAILDEDVEKSRKEAFTLSRRRKSKENNTL